MLSIENETDQIVAKIVKKTYQRTNENVKKERDLTTERHGMSNGHHSH